MKTNKKSQQAEPTRAAGKTPRNVPDTPHPTPGAPGGTPSPARTAPVTPVENALGIPTVPVEGSGIGAESANHDEPPAQEAIEEKNDRPAANTIMWAIVIAVIIMVIIYFMVFQGRDVVSSSP